MAKYLEQVIKEMHGYSDMPNRRMRRRMSHDMDMHDDMQHGRVKSAYRMNDVMRRRNAAEEEESREKYSMDAYRDSYNDDYDNEYDNEYEGGYDDYEDEYTSDEYGDEEYGSSDEKVEEVKEFFRENPYPSDEEVAEFAASHNMSLQELRQVIYKMIQELMGNEEDSDEYGYEDTFDYDTDEEDSYEFEIGGSDRDEADFVRGDTGERPSRFSRREEENEQLMRSRRRMMRRRRY